MTWAETVAHDRRARGLTMEQYGHLVGVTRQAVYQWETGRTVPSGPVRRTLEPLLAQLGDALPLPAEPPPRPVPSPPCPVPVVPIPAPEPRCMDDAEARIMAQVVADLRRDADRRFLALAEEAATLRGRLAALRYGYDRRGVGA